MLVNIFNPLPDSRWGDSGRRTSDVSQVVVDVFGVDEVVAAMKETGWTFKNGVYVATTNDSDVLVFSVSTDEVSVQSTP